MIKPFVKIASVGAFLALSMPLNALADNGRYLMDKTDDGYVRMDTQTGAMSICSYKNDQLVCKMAADERAAFNEDIVALEDRIAALEQKLSGGMGLSGSNGLSDEEEFERGLGYMEKFMRRFMGIVQEFDAPADKT